MRRLQTRAGPSLEYELGSIDPNVFRRRIDELKNAWNDCYSSAHDKHETLEGKVTFISPRAEFTPRKVQTAEERSKLVYRIKVTVDNRAGILKLGMPVDAELKLQ